MSYLIHVDVPIVPVDECAASESLQFLLTGAQMVNGAPRFYYAACSPHRMLIVMRNGDTLESLGMGSYAIALIGWDEGDNQYVLPANVGRRHTKMSIEAIVASPEEAAQRILQRDLRKRIGALEVALNKRTDALKVVELSYVLEGVPRSDRRGGFRGSQGRNMVGGDEPTERISVSLPASVAAKLRIFSGGDVSAAARAAILSWLESSS